MIDSNRLGFMHGDSFIWGSGLEGGDPIDNWDYLSSLLKDEEGIELPHLEQSKDPYVLSEKVRDMKEGDRLVLPGGWRSSGGGHAAIYIIEKTEEGQYAFTVLNTGQGIQYHSGHQVGSKTKYEPILRYVDIQKREITKPEFFRALFELDIAIDPKNEASDWKHSDEDIYQRILPALKGKRDEKSTFLITAQRSGTCSWKSIMKFIQLEMKDDQRYKHFVFKVRKKSLDRSLLSPMDQQRAELLKRSSENFARFALKQYKKENISKDEFNQANQTVQSLQQQVQEWEKSISINQVELDLQNAETFSSIELPEEFFQIPPVKDVEPHSSEAYVSKKKDIVERCRDLNQKQQYQQAIDAMIEYVIGENNLDNPALIDELIISMAGLPESEKAQPDHYALMYILASSCTGGKLWLERPHTVLKSYFVCSKPKLNQKYFDIVGEMSNNELKNNPRYDCGGNLNFNFSSNNLDETYDSRWIYHVYNSSEVQDKIRVNRPELSKASDQVKLQFVFQTFGTDKCPLPVWFQDLIKIHCLYIYTIKYPQLHSMYPYSPNLTFKVEYSSEKMLRMTPLLSNTRYKELNCLAWKQAIHGFNGMIEHEGLQAIISGESTDHYNSYQPGWVKWSSKNSKAIAMQAVTGFSRRETQEIAHILSNQETKIPNLIAYFKEHPEKCTDRDYQLFLFYQLCSAPISREYFEHVVKFLEGQCALQSNLGNIEAEVFFLSFLQRVTGKSQSEQFLKIAKKVKGNQLKGLVYQHYIASFEQVEKNDRELAIAFAHVKAHGFDHNLSFPFSVKSMYQIAAQISIEEESGIIEEVVGNGNYRIDLSTLTIFDGDHIVGALPYTFHTHPSFQTIIRDRSFVSTCVEPGLYQLKMDNGEILRVYTSNHDNSLQILKFIDGTWFRYISEAEMAGELKPSSFVHDHIHWVSEKTMIIEKEDKVVAELLFDRGRLISLRDTKTDSYLHDIYSNFHLAHFQPIETIRLWGKDRLEFYSLGIQLNTSDISRMQTPPQELPYLSGYLKLKDNRYLIPKGEACFDANLGQGALSKKFQIEPDLTGYYEFVEIDGQLVGKNPEENLYLAYLHLAHKNYPMANALLQQQASGRPKGFTPEEREIIDRLVELWKTSQDRSPEGVALATRVLYLNLRNTGRVARGSGEIVRKYLELSHHTNTLCLNPIEQKELLKRIPVYFNPIAGSSYERKLENFSYEDLLEEKKFMKLDGKTYYANGNEQLAKFMDKYLLDVTSEDVNDRCNAVLELHLLRVDGDWAKLRDHLIVFAEQASDDQRDEASNTVDPFDTIKRLTKSMKVHHAPDVVKEIEVESTKKEEEPSRIPPALKATMPIDVPTLDILFSEEILPQTDTEEFITMLEAPEGVSKVERAEFERVQESVRVDGKEQVRKYRIQDAKPFRVSVEEKIKSYEENASRNKEKILTLANHGPKAEDDAVIWQMKIAGKEHKEITIDDLAIYYLQNNGQELIRRNPNLTDEEVCELIDLLTQYLVDATELNYLRALMDEPEEKRDSILREKRFYSPLEEPVFLIFEYYKGFRLREKNVKTIRAMLDDDHRVSQLIMGSGKTKSILPILAFMLSRGDNVPIVLAPDSLFETNLEDMRILSGSILNQEVETILIDRDSPFTGEKISEILETLERVKKHRSYCLISQSTLASLYLHYKDIVTQGPLDERFVLIKELMSILINEGDLVIDEVDFVLDCLKVTNFSKGEWQGISEETQNELFSIFESMLNDRDISSFFKLEKESEAPFNEETFVQKIQPRLNKIMGVELQNLLKTSIQKNCNEHFGLSHTSNKNMAIPYIRSNKPSEGSEFGTSIESLVYSMLYYMRQGVTEKQLKRVIKESKQAALAEYQSDGTDLKETKAYLEFSELNLVKDRDLFSIQDSELANAVINFNQSMQNRMKFCRVYGWSEVGFYPERLSCNPQDFVGLFRSVRGFTGTLWNKETFHRRLNPVPEIGEDGKTLNILYRMNPEFISYEVSSDQFLESLHQYDACIDLGAWFRGESPKKVAEKILECLPEDKKAVVYMDTSGNEKMIFRDGFEVPLQPHERFTLYTVTTGVDIPQHAKAKALVTVSKTVSLRDLLQAVWRMRGLDKEQRVEFAVPNELTCNSLKDLLHLVIRNQGSRQQGDYKRALTQKVEHEPEALINKAILQGKPVSEEMRKLLINQTHDDPKTILHGVKKKVAIKNVVDSMINNTITHAANLDLGSIYPLKELGKVVNGLVKMDLLPEFEYQQEGPIFGLEQRIQIEQKSNRQTQLELEAVSDEAFLSKSVKEPAEWEIKEYEDLFTYSFHWYWGESVNDYLDRYQLGHPMFSDQFSLTGNFIGSATIAPRFLKNIVPFQSGTRPGGLCAVKIGQSRELSLHMLHPTEAEWLLFHILEIDQKVKSATSQEFANVAAQKALAAIDEKKVNEGLYRFSLETLENLALESINEGQSKLSLEKFYKKLKDKGLSVENSIEDALAKEYEVPDELRQKMPDWEVSNFVSLLGIERNYDIVIAHPLLGVIGDKHKDIEKSSQYTELMSQAKFFMGVLNNYSRKEREYLVSWVKENGVEEVESFFLKKILAVKPEAQRAYETSAIRKVIQSTE